MPQRHENGDDDRRDERQDDSVLGHCLAVLALEIDLHPLIQELEHRFTSVVVC